MSVGNKRSSLRRALLNLCGDQFSVDDIYAAVKEEFAAKDTSKMSTEEIEEHTQEYNFAITKTKKKFLGNIRFIGVT